MEKIRDVLKVELVNIEGVENYNIILSDEPEEIILSVYHLLNDLAYEINSDVSELIDLLYTFDEEKIKEINEKKKYAHLKIIK
ncbi:putative RecB family endonuclease [Sedimentibacter acidaminivorans]|uniref:RecB family endonuclease n=1 Tax=Sedimentibacter acidaminivorans TaxID=913099 RepID=A0ABS4GDR8_9FIRM|nr:hypothetical protein [Sedimentibacter acidaminivorans]MBP1925843.1 putative RecB family endonuclease [Sedimentibacter acidaminivorans]